ncbi:MAG: NAD-dependent epimerase/dehydratase family protein [Sphaerochaeta sp.]
MSEETIITAKTTSLKRILITGANSYVGTSFENYMKQWPETYQVDTVDMIDGSWREKDFSEYDVVFHVAGIAHVNAKKNMEALYYNVNTKLTIETAKHAKQCGVKQFIFMSSIIVYGESKSLKPVVITRETEPKPNGFYGNSKLQAEIGIKKLEDKDFKVVILRPPMIYGPGSKGNFPKLIALAKKTPLFPAYHNQRSMLYIENLCEFVRLIIENKEQGVFWPQNEEYVDTAELVKQLAKLQGKKIHLIKWMVPLIYFSSPILKQMKKMFGSLVYEKQISLNFEGRYQIVDLANSLATLF